MKDLRLSITHFKIIHTVLSLNELSLYPNQEGVYKILSGQDENETKNLQNLPTYGTLISYSSKKICHYVLALLRHGFLKYIFDSKSENLYLEVTGKGKYNLDIFLAKRKSPYSRTFKASKPSIVKIIK
ncbi:MAG TPA: RQC domain-containing protein [Bacilli bacterium]|nr:RQC domain-containing protein [Bacilli bacterium]HPS19227.1 RQC domain-containing protein [Bacilli bacterium]